MKKFLVLILALGALALPTVASAWPHVDAGHWWGAEPVSGRVVSFELTRHGKSFVFAHARFQGRDEQGRFTMVFLPTRSFV